MKRLIAATVIMLSSCTAYADYNTVKYCEAIGNLVAINYEEVKTGKITEQEAVESLKKSKGYTQVIALAGLAETENAHSYLKANIDATYLCLDLMQYKRQHSWNFENRAKSYYKHKNW